MKQITTKIVRKVLRPDYQCGPRMLNDRYDYDQIKSEKP